MVYRAMNVELKRVKTDAGRLREEKEILRRLTELLEYQMAGSTGWSKLLGESDAQCADRAYWNSAKPQWRSTSTVPAPGC